MHTRAALLAVLVLAVAVRGGGRPDPPAEGAAVLPLTAGEVDFWTDVTFEKADLVVKQ